MLSRLSITFTEKIKILLCLSKCLMAWFSDQILSPNGVRVTKLNCDVEFVALADQIVKSHRF